MQNRNKISAIVPAYNEESRINTTIQNIKPYVDEILVIDDGSKDQTAEVAQKAGAIVIRQGKNQGYIAAIKKGFKEATGNIVVTIDADGEFPAEKIPELIAPIINDKLDMVQGRRNLVPRISEVFITWLSNLKAPVGDTGTGFRALRKDLATQLEINGKCICGVFSLEVASKGARISEIPVDLQQVNKPRRIAWYHFKQFFYLLPWLFKSYTKQ